MSTENTNLTPTEIAHAATNNPILTTHTFSLGDRTFPVVYLSFEDYITFLTFLEPLFSSITNSAMEGFNPVMLTSAILKYCNVSLPEMVAIMARQTDPSITAEDVKKFARNPIVLASAVLSQVTHDKMIEDIARFFGQVAGLMKTLTPPSE